MLKPFFAAAAALFLMCVPVRLHAQGMPDELQGRTLAEISNTMQFVLGNIRFVMFHETGHLLVSEFDLPVLGREEDAVDTLSALVLLNHSDSQLNDTLWSASAGWMMMGDDSAAKGIAPALWDVHGLDQQRGYNIICMMFGKDPAKFLLSADAFGLPAGRRDDCGREYESAARSWDKVLQPYQTQTANTSAFTVTYYRPENEALLFYSDYAVNNHVLELIDKTLTKSFALAPGLRLTARECGVENAFWSSGERELTLCYELMPWFAKMFVERNYKK